MHRSRYPESTKFEIVRVLRTGVGSGGGGYRGAVSTPVSAAAAVPLLVSALVSAGRMSPSPVLCIIRSATTNLEAESMNHHW